MEAKLKSGDLSVANFELKDMDNMNAYQSVIDGVYNQEEETIDEVF